MGIAELQSSNASDHKTDGEIEPTCAEQVQDWVESETAKLVAIIQRHGAFDVVSGGTTISFGQLFQLYTCISDALVGIMMRARDKGVLAYEGDMLFLGVHEHVTVTTLGRTGPEA